MGIFDKHEHTIREFRDGEITPVENQLLEALRTLHDAGILTTEEYYEKKAKILDIN